MPKREPIVVDAANVAYEERSKEGEPKVSNVVAMRRALEREGFEPIFIADASLIHEVDDPAQLEALLDDQVVRQTPAGTDADFFILATAAQRNARVVSNDRFEEYQDEFPWIDERRVPFMIIAGQVQLYEPKLEPSD